MITKRAFVHGSTHPEIIAAIRRQVSLTRAHATSLTFHVAESLSELEAAFAITHEAYVEFNYARPSPSGLRYLKHHALPTTTTLVARRGTEVVGTVTVVQDNPFGLPMDSIFDLSPYRVRGRVAEIGSFALIPKYRSVEGGVALALCKFVYQYSRLSLGVDFLAIAVNPRHADFYEALVAFEPLPVPPVPQYEVANGQPAVGQICDLNTAPGRWAKASYDNSDDHDLRKYFCQSRPANFYLPREPYYRGWHSPMDPAGVEYFYLNRATEPTNLTSRERAILAQTYQRPEWESRSGERYEFPFRKFPRYPSSGLIRARTEDTAASIAVDIRNVSHEGALVFSGDSLRLEIPIRIKVPIGPSQTADVQLIPCRQHAPKMWGARLGGKSEPWTKFLNQLKSRYAVAAASDEKPEKRAA
jgi:hypothetical protein